MKTNQWIFLVAFFFSMQKNAIFLLTDFFLAKSSVVLFLTKTHLFCKSMQAFCLCSNFHCDQFFTGISYFFPLFSFGPSLKIPQTPVLSNIFSSSEIVLPRKFFILHVFFLGYIILAAIGSHCMYHLFKVLCWRIRSQIQPVLIVTGSSIAQQPQR